MNNLKYWSYLLLAAAGGLWFHLWLHGPERGPDIGTMDNVELVLAVLAIVCVLLAVTVLIIYKALTQNRN